MALATGAGTETLHAHHFEDVSAATTQNLIVGVQHQKDGLIFTLQIYI